MNFTEFLSNIQSSLELILKKHPDISDIVQIINKQNAKAYLVGGAVRDILLKIPIVDIDIEVHGLSIEQLSLILSQFGRVSYVGKSFGVLKIDNINIDWSLPRTDSSGRKPVVTIDPYMGIKNALQRRDLTINAMAIDLTSYEFIDPFNGYKDLLDRILRAPDINFFIEDPLRFFRVMQFISRFEMLPDRQLDNVCTTMDISKVSIERIEHEFEKLMLKSVYPSMGLRWLLKIKRLKEILPELYNTINIEQDPQWHPEGDVFEHTMQSVDAAAILNYDNNEQKLIIMFAALCHDLGKVKTTEFSKGRLRSLGHAEAGVELTRSLLRHITRKNKLIESVCILVKYHMSPIQFIQLNASDSAYKRLALKLFKAGVTMQMLAKLVIADEQGRNSQKLKPLTEDVEIAQEFIKRAEKAKVLTEPEKPILLGRDIKELVPVGPLMGKLLKHAYDLQIKKNIKNKQELLKQLMNKIEELK